MADYSYIFNILIIFLAPCTRISCNSPIKSLTISLNGKTTTDL